MQRPQAILNRAVSSMFDGQDIVRGCSFRRVRVASGITTLSPSLTWLMAARERRYLGVAVFVAVRGSYTFMVLIGSDLTLH